MSALGAGSSLSGDAADTCGARSVLPRFVPTSSAVASDALSGAMVTWGALAMTGAGGEYRLCWCFGLEGGGSECLDNDFPTDFGRLTVVGMFPLSQDRTCVAGMSCTLAWFTGESLSNGDSVIVMDTCGTREPPPGFEDGLAFFDELATCNATSNEGCENTDRIFRSPTFFGSGGEYRDRKSVV